MTKFAKIIYIFLFTLLLTYPHFIHGHILSIPEAYAQSMINLIILVIAYIVYILHKKDINTKDIEIEKSYNKLNDAFKYIGTLHNHLPLLKKLTTSLLKRSSDNKKGKKNIFNKLLETAIFSITKADWGMFRFIDSDSGNTVKDFIYAGRHYTQSSISISNKRLLQLKDKNKEINIIDNFCVIQTSDTRSNIRCFIIFPRKNNNLNNNFSILQSIVDQGQLFYRYLYLT